MVIKTKLGSCISAAPLNCNKHWFSYILSNYSQIFQLKGMVKRAGKLSVRHYHDFIELSRSRHRTLALNCEAIVGRERPCTVRWPRSTNPTRRIKSSMWHLNFPTRRIKSSTPRDEVETARNPPHDRLNRDTAAGETRHPVISVNTAI